MQYCFALMGKDGKFDTDWYYVIGKQSNPIYSAIFITVSHSKAKHIFETHGLAGLDGPFPIHTMGYNIQKWNRAQVEKHVLEDNEFLIDGDPDLSKNYAKVLTQRDLARLDTTGELQFGGLLELKPEHFLRPASAVG